MNTEPSPAARCPRCGRPIAPDAPHNLCRACLAGAALKREATLADAALELAPSVVFGDYELLEEIGRGAMGVVWRASQLSVDRVVALKFLQAGLFAADEARERFRREARAAAALRHPNIVAIHEVGERSGRPFFSMDFIAGRNLAAALRESLPSSRLAATWALALAEAMAHAHEHGVIHRDLKPGNILLDGEGTPHLTDFGLALVLSDSAELTLSGTALGTAGYMAPEQAAGCSADISPATDIHALGAVLYHLLTGRPPFHADSIPATLKQVVEADPVAPRRLNPAAPRDLETICLKCLEKVPAHRYATAHELAEELRRFLRNEPIRARPLSKPERLWRACRRHPGVTSLSVALGLTLMAGFSGVVWQWRQTVVANRQLATLAADAKTEAAEAALARDDSPRALELLAGAVRTASHEALAARRLVALLTARDFPLPAAPPLKHDQPISDLAFSGDGARLASVTDSGELRVWTAANSALQTGPWRLGGEAAAARFSPDGQWLAIAGDRSVQLRRLAGGTNQHVLPHDRSIRELEFSGDSKALLCAAADAAWVWNLTVTPTAVTPFSEIGTNAQTRLSPDGRWLVATTSNRAAVVWSVGRPDRPSATLEHPAPAFWAQFTPEGQRILTMATDEHLRVWTNGGAWQLAQTILMHAVPAVSSNRFDAPSYAPLRAPNHRLHRVELSPDGRLLAVADGVPLRSVNVHLLDLKRSEWLPARIPFRDDISELRFSPDGDRLFIASRDGTARLWNVPDGSPATEPLAHNWWVLHARFSPEGNRLATASADNTLRLWDVRPGAAQPVGVRHTGDVKAVAFSPDGQLVASGGADRQVRLWRPAEALGVPASAGSLPSTQPPDRLKPGQQTHLPNDNPVLFLQFSRDGRRLLTYAQEPTVRVWDSRAGSLASRFQHSNEVQLARLDAAGLRAVSSGNHESRFTVWDAATGTSIWSEARLSSGKWVADFSPDGTCLATGDYDGTVCLWHARDGRCLLKFRAHAGPVASVAFSPDNRRLLTASFDQQAVLWDARTGKPAAPIMVHPDTVLTAAFSLAGDRIATGCMVDRTAHVWDARTGQLAGPPLVHDGWVLGVEFSPDGECLATASQDGAARLWDVRTGLPLAEPLRHGERVWAAHFSPDGRALVTGSRDGYARVWFVPDLPTPAPDWLPTLAEALAGALYPPADQFEPRSFNELHRLRAELLARPPTDAWTRWGQWFFADRSSRPPQPGMPATQ